MAMSISDDGRRQRVRTVRASAVSRPVGDTDGGGRTRACEGCARLSPDRERQTVGRVRRLVFETIRKTPPGRTTAKAEHRKHWFRAKFGAGRLRLIFRYSTRAKIIVFAWVNDETTLRSYGARSDAYAVFRKMLDKGDPPEDWAACSRPPARTARCGAWARLPRRARREPPQSG